MRFATRLLSWSSITTVTICCLAVVGCNKHSKGEPKEPSAVAQAAGAPQAKAKAKKEPPSFEIEITAPAGKVGQELAAEVKVLPKGPYKINLEYPHKLKVSGPAAATPKEANLATKDAKISEAALLFKPAFKLDAAGEHAFAGKLRFSVCTKKQCELKAEKVKWVFKVTGD